MMWYVIQHDIIYETIFIIENFVENALFIYVWQGVNSIPELELQVNSNSNSGIGIGIGIEIGGI